MLTGLMVRYPFGMFLREQILNDSNGSELFSHIILNNKRNNTGVISLEYKAVDQLDRLVEIIKKNY